MESSTLLAFRIFVMLSCLIIVPMAAIFGSAFPDVVKTMLVDRIVAWSNGKWPDAAPAAAPESFSEVTPTGVPAAPGTIGEAPRWAQPNSATWPSDQSAHGQGVVPAGPAFVNPGAAGQSASFAAPPDAQRAVPSVYAQKRGVATDSPAAPSRPLSGAVGGMPGQDPRGDVTGRGQSLDQGDRFTAMERRLREYGATYYLLEVWGQDGDLYRFHCKMAIGNNPQYTRQFEATDRDALKAMAQVLEKVEMWREGRLQ